MIKNNKLAVIISSAIMLIPILAGVILWNTLPEKMPVHWGANGEADGFASKAFVVFGMPLIMLAFHWIIMLVVPMDKRNKEQSKKVMGMIFCIMPIISFFNCGMIYAVALGAKISVVAVISVIMGVIFMIIGNYMPKCKQNGIIGIKMKWTLENEACWNATHRFAGKAFFICGIVMLLTAFLPETIAFVIIATALLGVIVAVTVYAGIYYKGCQSDRR